jgi:hypothetical protein
MTEFTLPDCLVFKFEEIDEDLNNIDNTCYVFYDQQINKYIIRGQRKWTHLYKSPSYSYECENIYDLTNFLKYIICSFNRVNSILYNYTCFPYSSNDISFEFLNENDHSDYEIVGYNATIFSKKALVKKLRMLRNVSKHS